MKHRFDKKAITQALAYFCAALSFMQVSLWLNELAKVSDTFRYIRQCTVVFTFILFAVSLKKLLRLIPKTMHRAVLDKLLRAAQFVANGISKLSNKILRTLGFDIKRPNRQKDERSFIFDIDEINIFKKRSAFKSSAKWKDLDENSEKIRFIYIKYIIKKIKGGYKFSSKLTPCEIRTDLNVEAEQPDFRLFDLYNGARYSGGSVHISDEQVQSALIAVERSSKKK